MDTAGIDGNRDFRASGQRTPAAIVFGSASADAGSKPTSVRATCEAIGLPRSTYYYQSHRSAQPSSLSTRSFCGYTSSARGSRVAAIGA